ncbi:MAG: redoxin domain-containing protein [Candidatus Uhrbacteria bacterium]|nr:redoxin domain-containing protein [Candidatus Uhrbacteria bacterium]
MRLPRLGKPRMPEFKKGLVWLNGKPLNAKALLGKVVLIDFFTYSCVNCIRTLPHIKRWQERYGRRGLVIIGIHAPEFGFEHVEANAKRAIRDLDITYPVVLDNSYVMWNLFANRFWPGKYVINAEGRIIFDHAGEGGYAETERAIQEALTALGKRDLPEVPADEVAGGEVCYPTTPEVYLGYLRGILGNAHDILPDSEEAFTDKGDHKDDVPYLHGHWRMTKEYVEHTRSLPTASEYIALRYSSLAANLVMGAEKKMFVEVRLDENPVPAAMRGADIIERNGKTCIEVGDHRMYSLVSSDAYHRGTIKVLAAGAGLQCFAFTFLGCQTD